MDAKISVTRGSEGEICLAGRIDTTNAQAAEEMIRELASGGRILLKAEKLEHISSAGLRVLLRLKRDYGGLTMTGVSPEVYGILEMTGFTELLDVRRQVRLISVEGCEIIGEGAEGIVYRIDAETVVKVYRKANPEYVRAGLDVARKVFILGIPTAIPYDIVRTTDGKTGAVYELLSARSCASLLISGEKTKEEIALMTAKALKQIHSIVPEPGLLPEKRDRFAGSVRSLAPVLGEEMTGRLIALLAAMPANGHLIHGDFHIKNVMYQDGEALLIDMDTLSTGDPVFEMAQLYLAYVAFSELDPENAMRFFGIPGETARELYDLILYHYFGERTGRNDASSKGIRLIAYCQHLIYTLQTDNSDPGFRERLILHLRERIGALLGDVSSLALSSD